MERQRAVTTWWREINRINGRSRRAYQMLERAHANSVEAQQAMGHAERLADSRRIRAEAAAQACIDARGRLAVCEEQTGATISAGALDALLAVDALGSDDGLGDEHACPARALPSAERAPRRGANGRSAPTMLVDILGRAAAGHEPSGDPADATPPAFEPLVAERFFQGDRAVLRWLARELSELTGHPPSHFLLLLQELVEAVQVAAAERRFLVFDAEDPLWGQFSQSECRTISGRSRTWASATTRATAGTAAACPTATISPSPSPMRASTRDASGACRTRWKGSATWRRASPWRRSSSSASRHRSSPSASSSRSWAARADALDDLWDDWGRLRPMLLTEATAVTQP